jgi:hypothetical protein
MEDGRPARLTPAPRLILIKFLMLRQWRQFAPDPSRLKSLRRTALEGFGGTASLPGSGLRGLTSEVRASSVRVEEAQPPAAAVAVVAAAGAVAVAATHATIAPESSPAGHSAAVPGSRWRSFQPGLRRAVRKYPSPAFLAHPPEPGYCSEAQLLPAQLPEHPRTLKSE